MSCCVDVSRARKSFPPLRMASELTKTEISTMRVKNLREELQSRGLDTAGARPLLQDRLREGCCLKKNLNAPRPYCCFSHISVLVANPKKTTLHGGQSRSWSAEQGKNKTKKLTPPPFSPLSPSLPLSFSLCGVYVRVYVYVCVCVFIKLHVTTQSGCVYVCMCVYMCMCVYVCVCVPMCVYVYVCVCVMCVCMCMFIKFDVTAQSGPVTLVIPCHSHWSSEGGIDQ